ncbi:MAG TPA: helix-turn-helix domain-containing protein, partial [Thermomicrobiaceae bacterium]|nr:helix-turn-helix domain-containing protein [Thermomicrobiaceae bacterium]
SRRLSQAVADPRGVEALLASAAELAGRDLLLEDTEGNLVAWTGAESPAPSFGLLGQARALDGPLLGATGPGGRQHLIVALSGNPSPGYLSISGEAGTLTEGDRLILTQTAVTCGALLGQSPRRTAGRDGHERLVADLLLGRLASAAAAQARARTLGIDGNQPVVVGLAAAPGETAARDLVLAALPHRANLAPLAGGIGFLLPAGEQATVLGSLRRALERAPEGSAVALSRPVASAADAPQALREARFALALRQAGGLAERVIACDSVLDLGLYSLLFPLWGHPAVARFVDALLGPLLGYDQRRGTQLVETLEAYLSHGAALIEAAGALGVHRNTLAYRLQRVEELSGRDLGNPRDRLLLQVALAARRLPEAEG